MRFKCKKSQEFFKALSSNSNFQTNTISRKKTLYLAFAFCWGLYTSIWFLVSFWCEYYKIQQLFSFPTSNFSLSYFSFSSSYNCFSTIIIIHMQKYFLLTLITLLTWRAKYFIWNFKCCYDNGFTWFPTQDHVNHSCVP